MTEIFQYKDQEISIGNYVFDCQVLNAYIRRSWSAYGNPNVVYKLAVGAYGNPSFEEIDVSLPLDCSGYAWWSTYRKRLSDIWDAVTTGWKNNWVEIGTPIPGCVIRHSAYPGKTYGHVGFVISTSSDNFSTLDSSSNKNPPRKGSIRYIEDGVKFWMGAPNIHFLVSTQALKSVNSVVYKPTPNIYLAAAKRPIVAGVALLALLAGIITFSYLWHNNRKLS